MDSSQLSPIRGDTNSSCAPVNATPTATSHHPLSRSVGGASPRGRPREPSGTSQSSEDSPYPLTPRKPRVSPLGQASMDGTLLGPPGPRLGQSARTPSSSILASISAGSAYTR